MGGILTMEKLNINVFLCKEFDESTQSAKAITNQIELEKQTENGIITLNFVTLVSGYGENVFGKYELDCFVKCVKDTSGNEKNYSDKVSFLYTMLMQIDEETSDGIEDSKYKNIFQSIGRIEKKFLLPCVGRFVVLLYRKNDEINGTPRDRYRQYVDRKINPESVYFFDVV